MVRSIALVLLFVPLLAAQGGGTVEGVVVSTVTQAAIPDVSVTLFTRQSVRYETRTNNSGAFRVTNIAAGDYEVRFEKESYTPGRRDPPQPYRVAAGPGSIRLRLEMTKQITISGRVLNREGQPVARAQVKLDGRTSGVPTDEQGEYTIASVPPGFHTLLAVPAAGPAIRSEDERIEAVPTYYPSSIEPTGAQRVVVRDDADLTGYEIRIQTAAVHRVRGVVLSETGSPVSGATVQLHPVIRQGLRVGFSMNNTHLALLPPGTADAPEEARLTTGDDGVFEFPSVRSGEWQIGAVTMGSIDSPDFAQTVRSGSATTLVGRSDLDNLQIRLGRPFQLSGTTEWSGLQSRSTSVMLAGANSSSALFGALPESGPGDRFTLAQVRPGRYYIMPFFAEDYYPSSIVLEGREVLGQMVDLLGPTTALRVVFKPAQGIVRGKAAPGTAFILLLPDRITSMGFGRMARPKADGTFEMTGVPPGDYYAAAFTGPDLREIPNSAILERVTSRGTRVKVDQSSSATVDLSPMRWLE